MTQQVLKYHERKVTSSGKEEEAQTKKKNLGNRVSTMEAPPTYASKWHAGKEEVMLGVG